MWKVVCAPDSFKGSVSATEAADAMEKGVKSFSQDFEVVKLPLSDGGEGLVESLVTATGGQMKKKTVTGPLGQKVEAHYGILSCGRGVMEMAAASGLLLLSTRELNPLETSTYGTGELLKALLDEGCSDIIMGIGGSATNDGGVGMVQALGGKFVDARGKDIGPGGGQLKKIADYSLKDLDPRVKKARIRVACDVDNPLTGERGAANIYGPQKGATPEMVKELDEGLENLSRLIKNKENTDPGEVPGAGAAGGLGAGMMAFLGGELKPGSDLVLEAVGFEGKIKGAHLVITGEGRLDKQTIFGKTALGVVRRSGKIPVVAIGGWVEPEIKALHAEGLTAFFPILDRPRTLEEAMEVAPKLIQQCCEEIVRLFFTGREP